LLEMESIEAQTDEAQNLVQFVTLSKDRWWLEFWLCMAGNFAFALRLAKYDFWVNLNGLNGWIFRGP
jgi:hypothetical protein